jgi:hypothetical protein
MRHEASAESAPLSVNPQAAERAGLEVRLAPDWYDVDDEEGLAPLALI